MKIKATTVSDKRMEAKDNVKFEVSKSDVAKFFTKLTDANM